MSNKIFITDDFLLHNEAARRLYHDFAKVQLFFDYHCHLSKDIAEDRQFENLAQIWIDGDHYKYRAMRANGVDEKFITGKAELRQIHKWAATVPYTLRNPLYHWTHLELKNYWNYHFIKDSAESIYKHCSDLLKPEYSVKNILRKMNVAVVGTTDDPTDDLVPQTIARITLKLSFTFSP
jgi:glucuronate isomerase